MSNTQTSQPKNTVNDSDLTVGNNLQIGDNHYVIVNPPPSPPQRSNWTVKIVISFSLSLVVAIYFLSRSSSTNLPNSAPPNQNKAEESRALPKESPSRVPSPPKKSIPQVGGIVLDGDTQTPLPSIYIRSEDGDHTSTDEHGHFTLLLPKSGHKEMIRLYVEDPNHAYDPFNTSYPIFKDNIKIPLTQKKLTQ